MVSVPVAQVWRKGVVSGGLRYAVKVFVEEREGVDVGDRCAVEALVLSPGTPHTAFMFHGWLRVHVCLCACVC